MIYANPVTGEPTAGVLLMTGNQEFNREGGEFKREGMRIHQFKQTEKAKFEKGEEEKTAGSSRWSIYKEELSACVSVLCLVSVNRRVLKVSLRMQIQNTVTLDTQISVISVCVCVCVVLRPLRDV